MLNLSIKFSEDIYVKGFYITYSNLFIFVHNTHHHMLCVVAIVDCTHVHNVIHYKNISPYHILLLFPN